jgi:uncharacterized membrane protein
MKWIFLIGMGGIFFFNFVKLLQFNFVSVVLVIIAVLLPITMAHNDDDDDEIDSLF